MKSYVIEALSEAQKMLNSMISNDQTISRVVKASQIFINSLENKGTIFSCGNGGSMSDAMHFAEELSGRYRKNRRALSAIAISDPGHLSCVSNDFGYQKIFSRYLEANARTGDSLLAISTSGKSENVIAAVEYAKQSGLQVVSLTGKEGSKIGLISDIDICVGSAPFADRVQELHIKAIHMIIELIERSFFPENY